VKFAEPRPFSDPEAAVRKLIEIANAAEAVQDGRIYIERVNGPFLAAGGSPAEYRAGIERAIAKGWLWLALFGRRLQERADSIGIPASKNLHRSGPKKTVAAHFFWSCASVTFSKLLNVRCHQDRTLRCHRREHHHRLAVEHSRSTGST
jgi:hypothetical protein